MQQTYAGKDIARFIAAILWIVMGIIYVTYVFEIIGNFSKLKTYWGSGKEYDQIFAFYWIMLVVYAAAAFIVIMAAIYLFKEDTDKFGTAMYCYATGYILTVLIIFVYIMAMSNGNIVYAFSYLGSSLGKYLAVLGIACALVIASIYAQGVNYKKASRGVIVGGKSFVPLGIYLSSMICIIIVAAMLKNDFGEYISVSDIVGQAFKSQSGGGIALIIGIHVTSGLYIFLREKYFVGGSYGSMGYGAGAYGMSPYGGTGYGAGAPGMPPYGQTGYGMPPYGGTGYGAGAPGMAPYGQTGYGIPPYGQTSYGQPMGMMPGMTPMGMVPPQTKSKFEMEKEQREREFILKKGGWICHNCKKANYSYIGSCSCGMTRDESERLEKDDRDKAISEMRERVAKSKEMSALKAQSEFNEEETFDREIKAGSVLEASVLKKENKTWECLACHTVNDEDAQSCKNCGQIKAMGYKNVKMIYCPSCGTALDGGSKFCYKCGTKIN